MPQEFLMYKGRPLVRSGETLYYGSMETSALHISRLKARFQAHGMNMANNVVDQLILTDEPCALRSSILNQGRT